MTNGVFNPMTLAGQVYGIADMGISVSLLAGMARNIQDITYRPLSKKRYTRIRQERPLVRNPYQFKPKYTWRY